MSRYVVSVKSIIALISDSFVSCVDSLMDYEIYMRIKCLKHCRNRGRGLGSSFP